MQFFVLATLLATTVATLAVPTPSHARPQASVRLDQTYDNPAGNLNGVACSTGENGLVTKGFTTFTDLPAFPYVGGAFPAYYNSPNCGSCWKLTYAGTGKSVNILAIDSAGWNTFNIGQRAMDELTNGRAVELGGVPITYEQVDEQECVHPHSNRH